MGQGVGYQLARYHYQVILVDTEEARFITAAENIRNIVRLNRLIGRPASDNDEDPARVLSHIRFTRDLNELSAASVIIENVPEKPEIKKEIFQRLSHVVGEDTLIGVNTSATPVTPLSLLVSNPSNVLGIHFVNPVHLMSTVEMVRGAYTSEAAIQKARDFLATMKMTGILVGDSPGFVSNRVMLCYINEAILCVGEKVASAKDVDRIFRECLSHKMGPLETADLIGLDTIQYSLEVLLQEFKDEKYRPAKLLAEMVAAGLLGRKSGQGFYTY
jgi:3-hydroxybutyryl-CoA dehydrogenase